MRIAIVGSGGLGGYFGGRLAASGADVAFVARGAQLEALRTSGLRIDSPKGDLHLPHVHATDDPTTVGPVDVVFFAVKLYDTASALALLPPLLGPDTVVIPFQNGVESVDLLVRAIGAAHVAGGTAYVIAALVRPGVIRHTALDRIIFGEIDGARTPRLERLLEACRQAGVSPVLSERVQAEIWSKFVHLSALSGMTAVVRASLGPIRDNPDLLAMYQAAVRESMAVARAARIDVPAGLFDEIMANVQRLPGQTKSSMLEDLEHGRRLELPWLSGAVVRMGRELGVETPTHRVIATILSPHVNGRSER